MTSAARIQVLVVISHLAVGGAENIAITLAESATDSVDFTIFVVLSQTPDLEVEEDLKRRLKLSGINLYFGTAVNFKRGGVVLAAWRLRQVILNKLPDVIHVHTEVPELTLAVALLSLPPRWSKRVIRTVHNTLLWSGWNGIGRWVTRRLESAVVACVSKAAMEANALLRITAGAKNSSPIYPYLVYNGVSIPRHTKSSRSDNRYANNQFGTAANKPVARLLFAGRFEAQKGVDQLRLILDRAHSAMPSQADVTLIGSGSMRASVQAELENTLISWPITFLDSLPNLGEHLADYDLVLMPSRFEGLPLLAIEALLAGVPVVAFAAPGLSEVIPPTNLLSAPAGDIDAFAERIVSFLKDPSDFFVDVQSRRREMTALFSIDTMKNQYIDIYRIMASML